MFRRKLQSPSGARSCGISHQSTDFETLEDVEYHYQIGKGTQKKLNDLQMRRAELRRQFGSKLSRAASIKNNLDKYLALDEKIVEEMRHYSTRVSSKHKADLQEKQRNLSLKRKEFLAWSDQKKKSLETAKLVSFIREPTPSLVSSVNVAEEETRQNIEPPQNTSATETKTDQPKSKDVLPDVSTQEELKQKEEARAKRKRQVQLRLEYQMQKLKIEQERRARETDEQLRQLEEQKTLEMLKLEINSDEEDELHPENLENPIVPDSGDFLGNISCSDDENYLGENRKLNQAQVDNQQNAIDIAASSQRKYSNNWLVSLMSQKNSRKDGVLGSAPVRHPPGTVSSNQGQHSKFEISDTSQSSPKHGFNQYEMDPVSSSVTRTLPKLKLREYSGDPLDWAEWSSMFLSTVENKKNNAFKNAVNWASKKSAGWIGLFERYVRHSLETLVRKFGLPHLIIGSQ